MEGASQVWKFKSINLRENVSPKNLDFGSSFNTEDEQHIVATLFVPFFQYCLQLLAEKCRKKVYINAIWHQNCKIPFFKVQKF